MPRLSAPLNSFLCFLTLGLLFVLGCKKSDSLTPTEEQDNSLIFESFVFENKNNAFLDKDLTFEIKENIISGPLKHYNYTAIPTFRTNAQSVEINGAQQTSGRTPVDFRKGVIYTLRSTTGGTRNFTLRISWDNKLPQFNISTDGRVAINSKTDFVPTTITIDGQTRFPDFEGTALIRGRGNTTWGFPKKPYKFKLDTDAEILGLAAEKDWILLSNYLDGTHLLNAVGMKIGQLLDMPYTNNIIPVEVTLNGDYLGAYMLTEQIEVKKNRVNVGKDGLLLNLDTNFDEPYQFQSKSYQLPVTIKYPKEIDSQTFTAIKNDFENLEALVASPDFPNNNYLDFFDGDAFANYLIVYMLTGNEEINHPKSTYIHKTKTGKYTMGPVWDFDWAFAFEGSLQHFSSFDTPLFWTPPRRGTNFFSKFLEDPEIIALVKANWTTFQANELPELLRYIDEYTFLIQGARNRDFVEWAQGNSNFNVEVANVKNWLSDRARYMLSLIHI